MKANLRERKTNLLSQIEMLKRENDILNWPEYKKMALYCCTGNVVYSRLDRMQENLIN